MPRRVSKQEEGLGKLAAHVCCLQIQNELKTTADLLADVAKRVLDAWYQHTDDLPNLIQHAHAATAAQVIGAALQQAPRAMSWKQVDCRTTWLIKHIPGVSTAMQHAVDTQLRTLTKRLGVLQSLIESQNESNDAQLSRRIQTDIDSCRQAYAQLELFWCVHFLMLPVAALCTGLTWQDRKQGDRPQRVQSAVLHGMQQGSELLDAVAAQLMETEEARAQLEKQVMEVRRVLEGMGRDVPIGPAGPLFTRMYLQKLMAVTDFVWLRLSDHLPANHLCTALFFVGINWSVFCLQDVLDESIRITLVKTTLCRVLAKPLTELYETYSLETVCEVCKKFQITGLDLQRACMPAAQLQKLMAVHIEEPDANTITNKDWQELVGLVFGARPQETTDSTPEVGPGNDPGVISKAPAMDGNEQQMGDSCQTAVTDTGDEAGASAEHVFGSDADDLDEMQLLLRMMYGSTIPT